jgi:riboflavin biosynthesis pyrimidine reductase
MLEHMRHTLGAEVLLLEGGPTVNAGFFLAGAIDELFFTVGPIVVGGNETLTPVEGLGFTKETAPRLDLVSATANEETGEVYLRYRVKHEG